MQAKVKDELSNPDLTFKVPDPTLLSSSWPFPPLLLLKLSLSLSPASASPAAPVVLPFPCPPLHLSCSVSSPSLMVDQPVINEKSQRIAKDRTSESKNVAERLHVRSGSSFLASPPSSPPPSTLSAPPPSYSPSSLLASLLCRSW
eukprot:750120-Hanusia_phi.AAC.1